MFKIIVAIAVVVVSLLSAPAAQATEVAWIIVDEKTFIINESGESCPLNGGWWLSGVWRVFLSGNHLEWWKPYTTFQCRWQTRCECANAEIGKVYRLDYEVSGSANVVMAIELVP